MEIKIVEDKKNPLLERREIMFIVKQESTTPSKASLEQELAKVTKANLECIDIKHIYQKFGKLECRCIAEIYDKPRKKKIEAVKPEEAPKAEEKPAEAPKEEKKEEKSEEKPKVEKKDLKDELKKGLKDGLSKTPKVEEKNIKPKEENKKEG